jgi:hypothetical protein
MHVLYHLNPYLHTPNALRERNDPTGDFLVWDLPSVYGSVWMQVSFVLVALLQGAKLWWQVAAFKLLGALSLLTTALAGRALAERHNPGRGNLTLLAIGLNPLFLIEGPLSGHNDLFMMALFLTGALYYLRDHWVCGSLLLGLALGIKFVLVALVPWILLGCLQGPQGKLKWGRALAVCLLMLTPMAVCYVPLWQGLETFRAQRERFSTPDEDSVPEDPAHWLVARGLPESWVKTGLSQLKQKGMLGLVYLGLTLACWRRGGPEAWLTLWPLLALAVIFLGLRPSYPWYLVWPLAVSLTRWGRWDIALSAACLLLAAVFTMGYSTVWDWDTGKLLAEAMPSGAR